MWRVGAPTISDVNEMTNVNDGEHATVDPVGVAGEPTAADMARPGAGNGAAAGSHSSRGEYKTPGGKLVGVTILRNAEAAAGEGGDGNAAVLCRLDGDFFVDDADNPGGDEAAGNHADAASALIADIERTLLGGQSARYAIARHPEVRLVGADAAAIDAAFARAWSGWSGRREARDPAPAAAPGAVAHPAASPAPAPMKNGTRDDDGEEAEWRRRWAALHPTVVVDEPRGPEEQMRIDEQWSRDVAQGRRGPTVRFWQWAAPAVVIGRFQSLPDEVHEDRAASEGFVVVRRCTGGGAMFIEPGNTITYSLYAPRSFVEGVGVEASYRLCDQWLIDALRGLGVDARFAGINDIASSHGKIGGAAQRRFAGPVGAVLHHVTMAYDIDAEKMGRILNVSAEKMSDKAVRSARKRVDPLRSQTGLSRGQIVDRLVGYLRKR
ncbi:lipoate-protein ligase A [Bifidobacterium scardovii]|uniref:Lipoate-protein ligase A n=2 Tax=Bifidobacterium scardovii TaxID=158787 RepID=A0A087D8N3_9BIFI|nr:lipoate-protein ligase A [Bifidobacterium scardovii]